ncbi:hypothetical protein GBAR_LOCUS17704 [Geodia barretti]|uniref:Uncharacterized protein n=1 Tax=Geodia barretti TaxID=519541 RepID=A0AA35WWA9_GEOBA|nr:hypothetical protein GBAR_LOCUS17704 [Geodia barretti]
MITLKECQSQCIHKLGELRFDKTEDFFGSYFHYLQYGYYMLNTGLPAIQAWATQLQLEPHSDVAKKNVCLLPTATWSHSQGLHSMRGCTATGRVQGSGAFLHACP